MIQNITLKNQLRFILPIRNLRFFSNIFEIAPALEINFLPYNHGSKDHFFTPYLLGGFSVFRFSPMTKYDGKTVALRELGTEGQIVGQEYGTINGSLMVGGGVKLDINYRWSLNFDISYRQEMSYDFLRMSRSNNKINVTNSFFESTKRSSYMN